MTKLENYLKSLERKYAKKPRVLWLHRWVLEAFVKYASFGSYEKALRAKKLSEHTINSRLAVARRYLKALGQEVPRRARLA